MLDNRHTYESRFAVDHYMRAAGLQLPERAILDAVRPLLSGGRVLDVGVGGGRTSEYFAPPARRYAAIDYSLPMIQSCKRRFAERGWLFSVGDARQMPFPSRSFDLVLFSYNGIDYVSHDDRIRTLDEIRRVSADSAFFAFSSHNIRYLRRLLSFWSSFDPRKALRAWRLRRRNRPLHELEASAWAVVEDGALQGGVTTYYVSMEEQLRQLQSAGFRALEVYDTAGRPIRGGAGRPDAAWLYYHCQTA